MKRGKKNDGVGQSEDVTPAVGEESAWDGPTRAGEEGELAELIAESAREDSEAEAPASEEGPDVADVPELELVVEGAAADESALPEPVVETPGRLESILESLLYAADRPLTVSDLKRLVNERDAKKLTTALEALRERHADSGIQLASLAGGWQFRTHPDNGPWVAKLVAGRPQRLSRAMLEALAIIAYRQPITRPEIDEIRGVDCGPVLKTLLDRSLVRMIGKKEEVGSPILYGTTPEFLRTFSLRDLTELPTLREFHELGEAEKAKVEAATPATAADAPPAPAKPPAIREVDPAEEDELLTELDRAASAASKAAAPPAQTVESSLGTDDETVG